MDSEKFRDGIIDIHTRQFGTAAEIIVMILKKCIESKKLEFDLVDINNNKVEVKASKVFKKQKLDMNIENFYEIIINNSNRNRLIKQKDVGKFEFDCNIQQIKVKLFDKMIYLLFFNDVIEIFEIEKKQIQRDEKINYSDKQHRGNIGEGQFHINNKTYDHHKKHYFIESITYTKLMNEAKKCKVFIK